jgi:hypothetical protein
VRPTHVDIREEQGCQVRKQGVRRRVSRGHRLLHDREIRVGADYLGGAACCGYRKSRWGRCATQEG